MADKVATKKNEGVTASSLFALDSQTGHSKIYDELCDIVDRVSYSGVLNAEDATEEYPDAVDVEFEVTSEDSAPYSVMVYIYGKEENDEESQLSYSVHDEYNNNLKGYISAAQGAPLGSQKGYKISELSQMWDDIEKDIQTLVSNADPDESKKKEGKMHACSMQKKKEALAKKSEATYNPDKVKADEMRLDYLSGIDDFYDGVKKFGFNIKDRGYYGSGQDGVYYRTLWLTDGKRKSGPNTNHTIKIGYDTKENTPFVAIDQYVLGSVKDLLTVIDDNFAPKTMEALAKKSESKKNEGVYGTIRVDSENIAIKVQSSNVYPSSSGRSLSVEVPEVEAWFSTLSEFSDCIDGIAEDCNGYPDISRDGSDILVQINAPKEDENGEFNGDYEVIAELRCSTEITSTSLEGVVDLLNHD